MVDPIAQLARLLTAAAQQKSRPPFTAEGPQYYRLAYQQNRPFATPGPYQTALPGGGLQETQFRDWLAKNHVPFNPAAAKSDYDMRGFFASGQASGWRPGQHFPDTYKTPYDTSFSAESQYATKDNPFVWQGNNLVDRRNGRVVYRGG